MSWPWSQLGLTGPSSLSQVRRAYAEKLKITHPEEDPEGFQRLHSAYQMASRMARQQERTGRTGPALFQAEEKHQEESRRPPQAEEQDFDFEELLQGEESPRRPPQTEEQDFDFEELLQREESPRRPPQTEEQDFDFEELLQGEEPPRRASRGTTKDWDFERLFAEGEAERAEARRRRGEERRRAQEHARERERHRRREKQLAYEKERRTQSQQEQARWQNTETILHTIEMMYSARAAAENWQRFFQSSLFQHNKGSIDLIFGLEDFVSAHQDLDRCIQSALFLAYGFDKGVARPELRPLYQMLLPSWQAAGKEQRRKRLYQVGTVVGGILFVPLTVVLLTSGWLLLLLLFVVLVPFVLVKTCVKKCPLGRGKRADPGVIATILCLAAAAAVIFVPSLRERLDGSFRAQDLRTQVCGYMEEDYGVAFRSHYNKESPRFDNVFSPADAPDRLFLAGPDGDRGENSPGYTTNYPDMMVLWALEDFAGEQGLDEVDLVNRNQNLERWQTSGTYLIVLPPYGAGDTITALGERLEELAQKAWYQRKPPAFRVVLCSDQLAEGRLILQEYSSSQGAFDAETVRERYESSFGQSYCAQLIQECQLDRDFTKSDAEEIYTLANGGVAELRERTCCRVYGLDGQGRVAMEYYMPVDNADVKILYCVPGGFWENGGTQEQISFYQVVSRGSGLGALRLYYPWLP